MFSVSRWRPILFWAVLGLPIPAAPATPLANPISDASVLVRRGEIHKAMESLDQRIQAEPDSRVKSELIASRLVLHEFNDDREGYASALQKYISISLDILKKAEKEDKLYLSDLLLTGVAYGNQMHNKKNAADKYLRYERDGNTGVVTPSVSLYKTISKAAVAYRFKETEFSYDLVYRATNLLITENIRAPLTQLALSRYARILTYQICDQRELKILYAALNRYELLEPKNPTLAPHVKANLLGFLYDTGSLEKSEREQLISKLKTIALSVPPADRRSITQLVNQKEATELLIRWVSDDSSMVSYAGNLEWLNSDSADLSLMALGAKVFYDVLSQRKADLSGVNRGLENLEKFLQVSDRSDGTFGFAQSISVVLSSLRHLANGEKDREISALEAYVSAVLEHRQRDVGWAVDDVNRDDFVQLTVSLYVSKRLSVLDNRSRALAELNHYIVQTLALGKNASQVQASVLYASLNNDLALERGRGYLSLKTDRLRLLGKIFDGLFSGSNLNGNQEATYLNLKRSSGLSDIHHHLLRTRAKLIEAPSKKFVYFTRLDEVVLSDGVFFAHGNASAYGVSVSKFGNDYRSRFWSEAEISKQRQLSTNILNRSISLVERDRLNKVFWSEVFSRLHPPDVSKKVAFGSGPTYFDLPISIINFSAGWLVDLSNPQVFWSTRQAVQGISNPDGYSSKATKKTFDYSFVGIGDPIVQSQSQLAAIAETESLIRGAGQSLELFVLPPLPDTADELRAIASNADGPSILALGGEATNAKVKSLDFSQFEVTSFATHGVMSTESGLESPSLLLSDDGSGPSSRFLTVEDVGDLAGVSPVLLLSACNTASTDRGAQQAGYSSSLAEAFMARGAQLVISSYWSVDSNATKKLMTQFSLKFFKSHKGDLGSVSFWASVRELKLDHKDYLDWGAFVPAGDYRRPAGTSKAKSLWAERLWINDGVISDVGPRETLALISASKGPSAEFVTGIEVFDVFQNKLIWSHPIENQATNSAKAVYLSADKLLVLWVSGQERSLKAKLFDLTTSNLRNACDLGLPDGKVIHDVVVKDESVFLILGSGPGRLDVVKFNPESCSSESISVDLPRNSERTVVGVELYDFDSRGPTALFVNMVGRFEGSGQVRVNRLNQKVKCDYHSGLWASRLNWRDRSHTPGKNYLSGYGLPEISSTDREWKKRDQVYLRYSDNCELRNYLVLGDPKKITDWIVDGNPRVDRIPVRTSREVADKPSPTEFFFNSAFAYVNAISRATDGSFFVMGAPVLSGKWALSDSVSDRRTLARSFLASSSIFAADVTIGRADRVRSAVGCDGGFFLFSRTPTRALIGCRVLLENGVAVPRSIHLHHLK